jgi:hypothetical protein
LRAHGGQRSILGGGVHNYAAGVGHGGGNVRAAYDLIKQAGGTDAEATTLAGIAGAESRFKTSAHNPNAATGDNSYGLWQINMLGAMGPQRRAQYGLKSNEDLYNPATNARVALAMHRAANPRKFGGYGDWSTYRSGAYRQYLPSRAAMAAAAPGHISPARRTADNPGGSGVAAGTYGGKGYTHAVPGGPQSAAGSVSQGQPYVVGEHGPELFVPAKSGGIHKLPKAVQDAIRPYQGLFRPYGLLKGLPKGDYVRGGALPWDTPSDRNDMVPSETGERIMQEWLKKYGGVGPGGLTRGGMPKSPFTQRSLEDTESKGFQQGWDGRDWPGPNAAPKLQNINLNERLGRINLRQAGQTVKGEASLKIALEGFPRGTKTTAKRSGMFKDIDVDRGRSAPWNAG